jgi:hypothetical protein
VADQQPLDAVVTYHTDGFRSGVARFNELLAERLEIPCLSLAEPLAGVDRPLLSFKVSELADPGRAHVERLLARDPGSWDVFLHEYLGSELERRLVQGARRVHCGNSEIAAAVNGLNEHVADLWTPGLVVDSRPFPEADVSVFSFGMAHKIRTDMFRRLRAVLESSGLTYVVYVSAANHETTSIRDAEAVFAEMRSIFEESLFFLGNLSDVAVAHWLRQSTFFAAFFTPAVRANNTSVASAMEHGAIVVTNIDRYSPPHLEHGVNMIDICSCEALPRDAHEREAIAARGIAAVRSRRWDELVERVR